MIPLRDNIASTRTPHVAYTILGLNVAIFLLQLVTPGTDPIQVEVQGEMLVLRDGFEQMVWRFGLRPAELFGAAGLAPVTPVSEWITVFTSMFMHGGWLHIGGNMLYLWIFADNVEDAMGSGRFLVFYLLAGVAAAAGQVVVNPGSTIPMVGASGAMAGVLGAYLVLYPRARVLTLIPIFYFIQMVEIPALVLLGFWILLQVGNAAFTSVASGGTAWFAHIGGFLFGLATVKLFAPGKPRPRPKR